MSLETKDFYEERRKTGDEVVVGEGERGMKRLRKREKHRERERGGPPGGGGGTWYGGCESERLPTEAYGNL